MRTVAVVLTTLVALAASTNTWPQSRTDRTFTATGSSCDQVTWSADSLAKYPRIASACQSVMERDDKYYVKFQGNVRRVADRGKQLTIDFKGGDRLTLTPPENMSVDINGRRTPVSRLRPGDQLNFYIPQDQLAADFIAGDTKTAAVEEVPMTPAPAERVAAADSAPQLPHTAGWLPWVSLIGLGFLLLGATSTLRRLSTRRT